MDAPHLFNLEKLQKSIKVTPTKHDGWMIWEVSGYNNESAVVAYDLHRDYVYVWGFDYDGFQVVTEELYAASTEAIEENQGELDLVFDHLEQGDHSLHYKIAKLATLAV